MKNLVTIVLAVLACLAGGCLDRMAGSTSTGNTGKGTIAGRVVDAEGRGVAGARVKVVVSDHNPGPGGSGEVSEITFTEADGSFRTDSLADGYYNLFDSKGQQVAFLDSIGVSADSGALAPDAVLEAPGSVSGVVRLRPGHDVSTVFLVLIGTTTWSVPNDSIGNFVLKGLAEGEYRLRVISILDAYVPLDTLIRVEAGRNVVLPDTLRLSYRGAAGLPVVDHPALQYDSALLSVRVSWPGQDPSGVGGYNVYRRAADSGFVRVTPAPVKDSFFVDKWDWGFRPGRTYDYAITALDARGNEGLKGASSSLSTRAPFRGDTLLMDADCGRCTWDIDPAGTLWVQSDTSVLELSPAGLRPKWTFTARGYFDSLGLVAGLAVDGSGGIYLLSLEYNKVFKYDTLGRREWEAALPKMEMFAPDISLYLKRDTLIIWTEMDQILTKVSTSGDLISQDTVRFAPGPTSGPEVLEFDPEVGPVGLNRNMEIFPLDLEGKPVDHWSPTPHGYLRDFAVDEHGGWYLLWDDGRIEVFSAGKELVRTIGVPDTVYDIRCRHGILYMHVGGALVRMNPGN